VVRRWDRQHLEPLREGRVPLAVLHGAPPDADAVEHRDELLAVDELDGANICQSWTCRYDARMEHDDADSHPAATPNWLLDTSVFYWCASTPSQTRLRAAAGGSRLTTAPSTLLEILGGMYADADFQGRKRALDALVNVCGRGGILEPDTDTLVARAFGRESPRLDVDQLWEGVTAGRAAENPQQLASGVPDAIGRVLRTVRVADLRSWKDEVGESFKSAIDTAYQKVDPVLLALVNAEGITGHQANKLASLLQAMVATEGDESRRFALVGLAIRAGAISESDAREAVTANDMERVREQCSTAEALYDGSLDGFVRTYRHYHGYCAIRRPQAGMNDALDIDPLLYFRQDEPSQLYVTGEDLWVVVVNLAFPGRALDVKPIARKPAA